MGVNAIVTIIFQSSYATPIIRILIRVISDLKGNCNYLSDLHEMLHTKQLKDPGYNVDNKFSNFCYQAYILTIS